MLGRKLSFFFLLHIMRHRIRWFLLCIAYHFHSNFLVSFLFNVSIWFVVSISLTGGQLNASSPKYTCTRHQFEYMCASMSMYLHGMHVCRCVYILCMQRSETNELNMCLFVMFYINFMDMYIHSTYIECRTLCDGDAW